MLRAFDRKSRPTGKILLKVRNGQDSLRIERGNDFSSKIMNADEQIIPLVEEQVVVGKRAVETGRVAVTTRVEMREQLVEAELLRDLVEVRRVPIEVEVTTMPRIVEDGDLTIISIVEERLVVEKRLFVIEEIHLRRVRSTEHVTQPVSLAVQRAEIVRREADASDPLTTRS